MKEIKNKWLSVIVIYILLFVSLYYLFNIDSNGVYSNFRYNVGLEFYYNYLNSIFSYLIVGIMTVSFTVDIFYKNKMSGFQKYIISRIGRKKRMFYEIKKVVTSSFVIYLVYNLITLVTIHLFFSNISFKEFSDSSYYATGVIGLFANSKISLILYLIYSSIGFSIFTLFIYGVSYFIKNQYVYKISGIVLFTGMTVLTAILGNQLFMYFKDFKLIGLILHLFASVTLALPGVLGISTVTSIFSTHLYFWYTCFAFLIYSFILLVIRYNLEKNNG